MNIRLLGAVLLIVGSSGIGCSITAAYRREIRILRQLDSLIESIICDLQYRLTPLPLLFRNEAKNLDGLLRPLFLSFSEELEAQISPSVVCCLDAALQKHPSLPSKSRKILLEMGKSLGRFDLHGQLRSLGFAQAACQKELLILDSKHATYTRCCQACCLCVGAVIALLLL